MRAVYIAKGSPLLPPAFASIFDDSASSSLDVFFDPSSGLINLPGVTLGMILSSPYVQQYKWFCLVCIMYGTGKRKSRFPLIICI